MIKKNIKRRIKEYFFLNPTSKLRARQIEKEVRVPFPSVFRYTKELEKEEIIKSTFVSGVRLYSADRVSKKFLIEKKLFNISLLYESGLIDYIIEEYSNPHIILFGSFSRGEDIEASDIDIYIETPKKETKNMEKFEKGLQRKIQLFQFRKITEIKNKELGNNILNGVVLNRFVEVFK